MSYQIKPPPADLAPFVRMFFHARADHARFDVRSAPLGYMFMGSFVGHTMDCTYDGVPFSAESGLHLTGQIEYEVIRVRYDGPLDHLLTQFTATGYYRLFGRAASDLTGRSADIVLFDPDFAARQQEAFAGTTPAARFEANIALLRAQAARAAPVPDDVEEGVRLIEETHGQIAMSDLCTGLGVNPQAYARRFRRIVGLSPKFFARVRQLNLAVDLLQQGRFDALTALAQDCGFYDQSHFIRTMREFFEENPQAFLNSPHPELATFMREHYGAGGAAP